MSAIFGILRFDGASIATRDLERMANRMAHRGPDGRKFSISGPVGLGHCLLRVNGEDLFEAQPLRDHKDDLILVADCRIDNREELAEQFGYSSDAIHDMPDSAFVLHAHKKWGEDAARHLLGDFAFAIWDGRAKKLVLGRDHMGQRYVHTYQTENFVAFATEIPALWVLADVPRAIDEAQLGRSLMHELKPRAGQTPFAGIAQVPAATTLTITAAGASQHTPYWQVQASAEHLNRDEEYYVEAYRHILSEAVGCRVRRLLRNPGLFLSGGYDSSAIAGLVGPALARGRKLITVTSVMPDSYTGPIPHARRWAEVCAQKMPHLDARYVTREGLNVFSGIDETYVVREMPAGSYDFALNAMADVLADAGVRLLMDGHGGDQTLNPRGYSALAWLVANGHWRRAWRELRAHQRHTGRPLWRVLLRDVFRHLVPPKVQALGLWARRGLRPVWYGRPIRRSFAAILLAEGEISQDYLVGVPKPGLRVRERLRAVLQMFQHNPFRDIALIAAHRGMDLTQPFFDKRVVELGQALPEELHFKNGHNRYLGRRALKDVYPQEFQDRARSEDDIIPDFLEMAKTAEPQIRAELARLQASPTLARYIDFDQMKRLLDRAMSAKHRFAAEQTAQLFAGALMKARFLEWFAGRNR